MNNLERTLDVIAHMMDPGRGHSREEILVWKALIRHVERDTFASTGRIIVHARSAADLARQTKPRLSKTSVQSALDRLADRGLLAMGPDGTPEYQLFLARTGRSRASSRLRADRVFQASHG